MTDEELKNKYWEQSTAGGRDNGGVPPSSLSLRKAQNIGAESRARLQEGRSKPVFLIF